MHKQIIATTNAPTAIGTYSQAVRVENWLYVSGQLGLNPQDMSLANTIEAQIDQGFKNLSAILAAAGGSLDDVVKLTVYLTDLVHFGQVNSAMGHFFAEPFPARAAVGIKELPKQALFEVDAVAYLDS